MGSTDYAKDEGADCPDTKTQGCVSSILLASGGSDNISDQSEPTWALWKELLGPTRVHRVGCKTGYRRNAPPGSSLKTGEISPNIPFMGRAMIYAGNGKGISADVGRVLGARDVL